MGGGSSKKKSSSSQNFEKEEPKTKTIRSKTVTYPNRTEQPKKPDSETNPFPPGRSQSFSYPTRREHPKRNQEKKYREPDYHSTSQSRKMQETDYDKLIPYTPFLDPQPQIHRVNWSYMYSLSSAQSELNQYLNSKNNYLMWLQKYLNHSYQSRLRIKLINRIKEIDSEIKQEIYEIAVQLENALKPFQEEAEREFQKELFITIESLLSLKVPFQLCIDIYGQKITFPVHPLLPLSEVVSIFIQEGFFLKDEKILLRDGEDRILPPFATIADIYWGKKFALLKISIPFLEEMKSQQIKELSSCTKQNLEKADEEWQKFQQSLNSNRPLSLKDIPIPTWNPKDLENLENSKDVYKQMIRRWHPDKWQSVVQNSDQKEEIMEKITQFSQQLNGAMTGLY